MAPRRRYQNHENTAGTHAHGRRLHRTPAQTGPPGNRLDEMVRLTRKLEDKESEVEHYRDLVDRIRSDIDRIADSKRHLEDVIRSEQYAHDKIKAELRKRTQEHDMRENKTEARIATLKERLEEQDTVIELARKLFHRNRDECKKLTEENEYHRTTIQEEREKARVLDERISQMIGASSNELTELALEKQAEGALKMVQGLQKDVADRDEKIKRLESVIADRGRKVKRHEKRYRAPY